MRKKRKKIPPQLIQRYEAKFVIPERMIGPISEFASVYCSLDTYSQRTANNFYRVNNLYFDTPNYTFLKNRMDGIENRFNMRIRLYSDTAAIPCIFEIKQKQVNFIKKYRATIYDKNWHRLFNVQDYRPHKHEENSTDSSKNLFLRLAYSYNATPKILSQYMRKAYVSDVDEYGRVTFDTDLQYQHAEGYSLLPDKNKMVPLDNETLFDSECNVVLELKCYSTLVPLWMVDLIRYFDLKRRNFSKYVTGITNVLQQYQYDPGLRQTVL